MTLWRVWRFLRKRNWRKAGLFVVSIALFVLALELMKAGARGLGPLITEYLRINNPVNALGFGWLMAYGVLSGSPVAAAALTFFDTKIIDAASAFAMINGSRMGASLIVLIIGLIYTLRGHERSKSLITGLLSLMVTATTYLPAMPIGYFLIVAGVFGAWDIEVTGRLVSVIDLVYQPTVSLVKQALPLWAVFLVGLVLIVNVFNLFDKAMPSINLAAGAFDRLPRALYRPAVVFLLGFAVTFVTTSVSVSLGLLVPLSARGIVRRENLIPYIMGCNISTFVDTLIAGLLLRNVNAASIVLAEMLSIAMISSIILLFFYPFYERNILRFVLWLDGETRRLVIFFMVIFIVPIVLLFIR
jgi:sodium-dependent phosphate cotransporter